MSSNIVSGGESMARIKERRKFNYIVLIILLIMLVELIIIRML
jgi:hypothetical protein